MWAMKGRNELLRRTLTLADDMRVETKSKTIDVYSLELRQLRKNVEEMNKMR